MDGNVMELDGNRLLAVQGRSRRRKMGDLSYR